MADGKVEIEVNVDGNGVIVLNKRLDQLEGKSNKASASIKNLVVSLGLIKVASAAFNALKNSLDSAISRFDTMQKFPKVMKALGFSAEDSQRSINKLSDGIDGLPTKLDDVVANTQQMTAITGDLEKSTDTVLALNNAFLASGASTEDASRGMQQYNQMLSTGTVDLESWKTLQETMPLALQKTAEAMGFVGKSAQRDLYNALKEGTVTFDQFQDKLIELGTGTGMLASLARENSLGISTSFGNLKNAVSKNVANIITKLDEIIHKLTEKTIAQHIDSLKGIINSFGNSVVKSMDSIIPMIEKITEIIKRNATVFRILGVVVTSVVGGFFSFNSTIRIMSSVQSAINGVKKSFELMKLAILGNPFALVIASISILVSGLIYLYKTNENVRNSINNLIGKAKEMLRNFVKSQSVSKLFADGLKLISRIGDKVASIIDNIGKNATNSASSIDWFGIAIKTIEAVILALLGPIGLVIKAFKFIAKTLGGGDIGKGIDTIRDSFSDLADGIKIYGLQLGSNFGTALNGILTAIGAALPGIISGGLAVIGGFITGIAQGLPHLSLSVAQLIMAFTSSLLLLIPTIVQSATSIITAFLGALTIALPQVVVAGANLINVLLQGITQQSPVLVGNMAVLITTWLASLNSYLPMVLQAGFSLLINFLQGIANNIGQVTQQALNIILNFAQVIAQNMPTIVNTAVNLMVNFTNTLASRMPDIISAAAKLIVNFVNGIANNLGQIINAAVNLIVKFLKGIANKIPDIVNAAMDLVDAMVRGVVQSQGRLMDAVIDLVNGFADNIRNRQEIVRNAAFNLLDAILGVFVPDALLDAGWAIIDGFLKGLEAGFEKVKSFVSGIAEWIKEHKGPLPYDKRLLIPAGKAMMYGLNESLKSNFKSVQKTISTMANSLERDFKMEIPINVQDFNRMISLSPESALGTSKIGSASAGSRIINNTNNQSKSYQPIFHINIEKADLSSDRSIEETSKELAILTERQTRGRLE